MTTIAKYISAAIWIAALAITVVFASPFLLVDLAIKGWKRINVKNQS